MSHASYLINLAAPPGALREKSIDAMVDELDRAHALALQAVVVHPGVAAAGMSEDDALALVAAAVQTALTRQPTRETLLLLEHTAGQGRSIGYRFEHLAAIIEQTPDSSRVGVCLDTCHLLASGYDISSAAGYSATFEAFERQVGMRRLRLFHANDSKRACGSRLDRHEHIGQGFVGSEAFGRILNDSRFDNLAMVIETHKTPGVCDHPTRTNVDPLDAMNLDALRSLRVGRSLPLQSPQ